MRTITASDFRSFCKVGDADSWMLYSYFRLHADPRLVKSYVHDTKNIARMLNDAGLFDDWTEERYQKSIEKIRTMWPKHAVPKVLH